MCSATATAMQEPATTPPKVELALSSRESYTDTENKMFELLQKDEYFVSEGAIEQSSVQTLSHMSFFRNTGALFGTAEAAEAGFNTHAEAIRTMTMVATAVQASAQDLYASIKAVNKAKEMEQKEQGKEEKRRADAEARKAKAAAKKKAQQEQKERAAAEQKQQRETHQQTKRRQPNIASEMTDTDPEVLKTRFPDHQITICETIDSWCCLICPAQTSTCMCVRTK